MISKFGLIIIGDELLFGNRIDKHQAHFQTLLRQHGKQLTRCWILPDEQQSLIRHLSFSMCEQIPVFVCGGIGATPDDLTRNCAAEASGVSIERHSEAKKLIEGQFGESAYPTRIKMADLPSGCKLIPNPHNQIPGFTINHHYFLPGFPEMAWPMAEWVLKEYYSGTLKNFQERSLLVLNTPESSLVPLMDEMNLQLTDLKLFSLPKFNSKGCIELGLRGDGEIDSAFETLQKALIEYGIPFQKFE
ncbi:MAG: molybdopterin-binding protein [Candidatus Thiodiazotropha sp. 6PDIVS]